MTNLETLALICTLFHILGVILLAGFIWLPRFTGVFISIGGFAAVIRLFLPLADHQNPSSIIGAIGGVCLIILGAIKAQISQTKIDYCIIPDTEPYLGGVLMAFKASQIKVFKFGLIDGDRDFQQKHIEQTVNAWLKIMGGENSIEVIDIKQSEAFGRNYNLTMTFLYNDPHSDSRDPATGVVSDKK